MVCWFCSNCHKKFESSANHGIVFCPLCKSVFTMRCDSTDDSNKFTCKWDGTINGKTVEQINQEKIIKLLEDIKEMLKWK